MRPILALAFLVVATVAAFTYRDLLLPAAPPVARTRAAQRPRLAAVVVQQPVVRTPAVLSPDSLAAVDAMIDSYMTALQVEPANSALMRDLAHLYMQHGWFDRAVGPLARALELDSGSTELHRYLTLALARAGMLDHDLSDARAEFLELLEMWGEGC